MPLDGASLRPRLMSPYTSGLVQATPALQYMLPGAGARLSKYISAYYARCRPNQEPQACTTPSTTIVGQQLFSTSRAHCAQQTIKPGLCPLEYMTDRSLTASLTWH
jgi:hypothetical protein